MSLEGKVAIVTGASSGIGEAIAALFVEHKCKVVVTGRREDRLAQLVQKLGDANALSVVCDAQKQEDHERVVRETLAKFGRVDILVNNAGVMLLSYVEKLQVSEWMQMVDTNIKGPMYATAAVLPAMQQQKSGHIVNISSDADRKVFPGSSVYSATKAALTLFSEGVRAEMAKDQIRVTSISPGATMTELAGHITDQDVLAGFSKSGLSEFLSAGDVAQAVLYAVTQPRHVDVHNIMLRPTQQTM